MIKLLILIAICTMFSFAIQRSPAYARNLGYGVKGGGARIVLFGIMVYLILFAGLRTGYNDTYTYISNFKILPYAFRGVTFKITGYAGFEAYQAIIYYFISPNPQVFLFITAVITTVLYVRFLARYSEHFGESMYLFLIGAYISTMAGIKQAMATGIVLYAVPAYFRKKYKKAIFIVLLAMSIHPYVICLCSIVLLCKSTYDKKTMLIAAACVFVYSNLDLFLGAIEAIGKNQAGANATDYTINPVRVVVEAIPVVLSFNYRKKINRTGDVWLIAGINLQMISFVFIFMGLFFNPIMLGRMSVYFNFLSIITIPKMLDVIWGNRNKQLTLCYYLFFFAYFMADMLKLGAISFSYDQFKQTSIMSLFKYYY